MEMVYSLFVNHPLVFGLVAGAIIFVPLFLIPAYRLRRQSGAEVGGAEKVA